MCGRDFWASETPVDVFDALLDSINTAEGIVVREARCWQLEEYPCGCQITWNNCGDDTVITVCDEHMPK